MNRYFSIFSLVLIVTVGTIYGQTSWLDRPVNNWNNGNGVVPNAPRPFAPIDARCQSQIRQPDSIADRAVTRAGWSLFGSAQTYGQVTLINGMASTDGMCRPMMYNSFVFVNNRFAGTLSPTSMDARSDSSLSNARLNGVDSITADFARYRANDALCCPSQTSMATYTITGGTRPIVRATEVTTSQNCSSDEGDVTTQDNVISGTITYRQRIALPPNAVVTVRLVDVSRADAPSTTVVEQRVDTNGRQAPFSFEFAYDRTKINERNRYAVQAEIRDGGRLIYITDTSYPVITQGNPKNVDIIVVPVGGGGGSGTARNTIRGTVSYLQRIAMTGNSEVRVWLVDAASPNGPVIAETTFSTGGRQVPYQFELRYENRDIDRQRSYEVWAEIRTNGEVRFRSERGTIVNFRGFAADPIEVIVVPSTGESTPVTGRSLSLSKLGAGSMRIGDRQSQFLVRGSVVVTTDGTATVTVGTITSQTVFTGRLVYFDNSTLRIAISNSGAADASGEIEVSYTDRRLNTITGNNLVLDGQAVVLRF